MSEQHISPANMRSIAQAMEKDKASLMSAVQAIIEGKPVGESSLDEKIVGTWEGMSFTEREMREDRLVYNGQVLRRHRNGSGWVPLEQDESDPSMPFIAETAYVGPSTMVYGNARISGNAQVYGNAWISGNAQVYGNAMVFDDARIFGDAQIFGNAQVSGNARIFGDARISGNAQVSGNARIFEDAQVFGDAWICNSTLVSGVRY